MGFKKILNLLISFGIAQMYCGVNLSSKCKSGQILVRINENNYSSLCKFTFVQSGTRLERCESAVIGKIIVQYEQNNQIRAAYGEETLQILSHTLSKKYGKGFSRSNIYNMRLFYINHPNFQTVSGKLTWSHYCELQSITDNDKRNFYERECINSSWSIRELKRQISSSLFERLLLSKGDSNKEAVLELASQGISHSSPEKIIKDPYAG